MQDSVVHLLDPEIVIPSSEAALSFEFWDRMVDCAEHVNFLLGPSTLASLLEYCSEPPQTRVIAENDFWRLISKYSSRVYMPSGSERNLCESHITADYHPNVGSPDNLSILIEDLKRVHDKNPILLGTSRSCWHTSERSCSKCDEAQIYKVSATDPNADLPVALRTIFLDRYRGDLQLLERFSKIMFPSISFSDRAWKKIDSIPGETHDVVSRLVLHLGVLNDKSIAIWDAVKTPEGRQRHLSRLDVLASPESPRLHKDKKAMRKRDFVFNGTEIRCEWHTKLWPHIGRIYFAVREDSVYVGAITDHL